MPRRKLTPREPLSGRLALITGGNRGIGLAIARALAREGCDLIITGRDERALARAHAELVKLEYMCWRSPVTCATPTRWTIFSRWFADCADRSTFSSTTPASGIPIAPSAICLTPRGWK